MKDLNFKNSNKKIPGSSARIQSPLVTGRPTKQSPSRKGEPAIEEKPSRKVRRNSSGQFTKQSSSKRPHDSRKPKNEPKENGVAKKAKTEPKLSSPMSPAAKRSTKNMKGLTGKHIFSQVIVGAC